VDVNVFILNLAVGDLMLCFAVSEKIPSAVFGQWVLGPAACKLIPYVQLVTIASTTFLLTAMSIDRYQVRTIHVCCRISARACGIEHFENGGQIRGLRSKVDTVEII